MPEQQELQIVFDTGSDWLVIESINCSNCEGENFDVDASKTFKARMQNIEQKKYGSATLDGAIAKDKVCLLD